MLIRSIRLYLLRSSSLVPKKSSSASSLYPRAKVWQTLIPTLHKFLNTNIFNDVEITFRNIHLTKPLGRSEEGMTTSCATSISYTNQTPAPREAGSEYDCQCQTIAVGQRLCSTIRFSVASSLARPPLISWLIVMSFRSYETNIHEKRGGTTPLSPVRELSP